MARILDKGVNQHKRLACGDTVKGYAQGGHVNVGLPSIKKPSIEVHRAASPLRTARSNNGVRGMKTGGGVK